MGEWMIRKSVKFPTWMLERLAFEKDRFAPFCENESDVIRLLLRIVFRCLDAGMLEQLVAGLQGGLGSTLCAHCGTEKVLAGVPEVVGAAALAKPKEEKRPRLVIPLNPPTPLRAAGVLVVRGMESLRFHPFRAFGFRSPTGSLA